MVLKIFHKVPKYVSILKIVKNINNTISNAVASSSPLQNLPLDKLFTTTAILEKN